MSVVLEGGVLRQEKSAASLSTQGELNANKIHQLVSGLSPGTWCLWGSYEADAVRLRLFGLVDGRRMFLIPDSS